MGQKLKTLNRADRHKSDEKRSARALADYPKPVDPQLPILPPLENRPGHSPEA